MLIQLAAAAALGFCTLMSTDPENARPMSLDDLFALKRISDPQISPDGKRVVYVVSIPDVKKNSTTSTLWMAETDDPQPRQLTNTEKHDRHPRWSPDGRRILFESDRGGESQLWVIDVGLGGEARQVTKLSTGAHTGIWSPDGKTIAFTSSVFPEFSDKPFTESDAANKAKKEAIEKGPVKARVFTTLFYRHWDSWVEGQRQHLFIQPIDSGEPHDLTPGDFDAYPTSSTFSLGDDFTFSPDGKFVIYTSPARKDEAWSTNSDLWRVPVEGGESKNLTQSNLAADSYPRFSPDGQWLAYRAQQRAGFEADRWQLIVREVGSDKVRSLTAGFDASVEQFVWAPDSSAIFFVAERQAAAPIFRIAISGGEPKAVVTGGTHSSLSISAGGRIACTKATLQSPPEVFVVEPDLKTHDVSRANGKLLAQYRLPKPESVNVPLADGGQMQMWIIKPPGFSASKKWPLAFLVHGGPQGAWEDNWSFRWCPELWAAQGYVVALPNPRGSTGFGQKFVDEISGDWGGKCFDDLMAGVAYLERQPYIDTSRMAAAGASFGGYMMNWFEGHTDKFKTLISHCGVYNFDSMYATTDELWFDEWEHGGPPWETRESYERHSPHRFAKNFKTPMLIIHNDLDFRVPISEGYQLFTTLQRLGIESKLIEFPDEGHWVLKPANSQFWHREIFAWLTRLAPPGPR